LKLSVESCQLKAVSLKLSKREVFWESSFRDSSKVKRRQEPVLLVGEDLSLQAKRKKFKAVSLKLSVESYQLKAVSLKLSV
jgi:hypothetical protein